jgi:serine/threonine protein kinase/Flp pilus assembly protein TadD
VQHSNRVATRRGLDEAPRSLVASSVSDTAPPSLLDQLQASLGGAYTIERELGGGGMSRVFLAEERAFGRRVVVKVLPEDLVGSVSTARFRREMALAAQLQHPHIVPLLSAGEIDGLPYYTMPFVDGESLRTRLAGGELPVGEVISILRDVARAMEYAHGKGVAHRDIKPDNVLLAGTSAVITDFGVAKALSGAAAAGTLTSIGVALGTPAYMAPEQAAADPATDLRADIYSFGVMAYEMLAGHPPFPGRSMQAMLAAHATELPPPISTLRPAAPPALAALVMRCLEKRPGDRPQSAAEVARELESLSLSGSTAFSRTEPPSVRAGASRRRTSVAAFSLGMVIVALLVAVGAYAWLRRDVPRAEIRSIAVLPFENASRDTTFDYLEDGISDRVRDALHALAGLSVKARSSSRQMRGKPPREVGTALGVAAVLQGAVSRVADRLHVTAELVRVSNADVLWSATFDGGANQLAGIQDSIVRGITGTLRVAAATRDSGRSSAATGARGTDNIDAYYSFLQANYAGEHTDWRKASELYRYAVALDPRFARAHGFLAMSYANESTLGTGNVDSLNALARTSAARALALDSTVVEAYVAQSYAITNEMRFADAVAPLERAYRIDSTNADVLLAYGFALGQIGRVEDAVRLLRRAREADPLSLNAIGVSSYMLELARRYDEAIPMAGQVVAADPRGVLPRQGLGYIYAFAGKPDSALVAFQRAFAIDSTALDGRANLVFGYALLSRWGDATRQRALLGDDPPNNSPNLRQTIVHLAFGEYDGAMASLERGVTAREPLFGILSLPCDPLLDPLKSNPRFEALMRGIGARACPATGKWPIAEHR